MRLFSCQRSVFGVAVQVQQIALGASETSLPTHCYDHLLLSVTGKPAPPSTGIKKLELHLQATPGNLQIQQTVDVFERFPFHGTLRHRSSKYRPQLIQFCLYGIHKESQRRTLLARFMVDVIEHFDELFKISANYQSSHSATLRAKGGLYRDSELVVWMDSLHFVRPKAESALHLRRQEFMSSDSREIEMTAMGAQLRIHRHRKRICRSHARLRCLEEDEPIREEQAPRKRVSLSLKVDVGSPEDDADNDDHEDNDNHKSDEPQVIAPTSPQRPGTGCRTCRCPSYRELMILRRENQWQRDLLQLLTKQNEQIVTFHRNAHAAATERARSKSEGSSLLSDLETNQENSESSTPQSAEPVPADDHCASPAFDEISFDGLVHQIEQEFRLLLDSHNEHACTSVAVLSTGE